jgi:hypothetical protein
VTGLKFVGEFVDEISKKKTSFFPLFGLNQANEKLEKDLHEELDNHWHELPETKTEYTDEYAVDSSSAMRSLRNGVDFYITRGLIVGTDKKPLKKLHFDMRKGSVDVSASFNYERILRDWIEIQVINENIDKLSDNSIILLDGNLHGRYTHLLNIPETDKLMELSLDLIHAMQTLYKICDERKITLVGVSKFSRTQNLTKALKRKRGYGNTSPDFLDVDALDRWKEGTTGITKPLLLGVPKGLGTRGLQRLDRIKDKIMKMERSEETTRRVQAIENYPYAPAIVMYHMIAKEYRQPLRVDIPVSCLGRNDPIMECEHLEFLEPAIVDRITSQLVSDFGGRDVYNALLYVVDKEVRLSGKVVDTVYKSLIARELGVPIEYDRSSRRFTF